MENKCDMCIHNEVCDHNRFGWENCGHYKPSRAGYTQQYNKSKYEARKANHQCVVCGCELDASVKTLKCEKCRIEAKKTVKRHFHRRNEQNLCRRCGQKLPQGTQYKACFTCRQEECRKRSAKNEKRNRQK